MSQPISTTTPADVLKQIEKDVDKNEKTESKAVKHAMKDLAHLEKTVNKSAKTSDKASHTLAKTEKKESAAAKAIAQANHKHDAAVGNVNKAQEDLKIKHQRQDTLRHKLEGKKAEVDQVLATADQHHRERESRLAQVHSARAGSPTASAGTA
ncbi:hypothetical protein BD626DRAFT_534512 [Schizophyllum amplum]|uniref:Uncharacterized protein n=1 Tax=Schizophyllum amplum TaxID=97359 RepID=A0A550CUM2_9AGAR|nr:hypothetical protein BD626DRAFT_534512 [Auriculariopsis ampla]